MSIITSFSTLPHWIVNANSEILSARLLPCAGSATGLNDAVGDDFIVKNPCAFADLPKQKKYKSTVLTQQQAQELLKAARGSSIFLEVLIAITLGLRRGEVLGLKFSDFDFKNNTVHVQRQLTCVKDKSESTSETSEFWGLDDLKTDKSDRTLSVPTSVIDEVLRQKQWVTRNRLLYGEMYNDMNLVCCTETGDWRSPQTVYHIFKNMLVNAELPDIRFHDLRHSCATILLNSDIPLKVISDMLGHSSLGTTADIYCEVMEKKKQTASTMEAVLFAK